MLTDIRDAILDAAPAMLYIPLVLGAAAILWPCDLVCRQVEQLLGSHGRRIAWHAQNYRT